MNNKINIRLRGSVLPTVIIVSVLILTAMMGLMMLHGQQNVLFARNSRLRQSRADAESAYTLYRLHPEFPGLQDSTGFQLYDSIPASRVHIHARPWGLYEAIRVTTSDSLSRTCRIFGSAVDAKETLWYADGHSSVGVAGRSILHGMLYLPANGIIYSRIGSQFFCGEEIPSSAIKSSNRTLPQPTVSALEYIAHLFSSADTAQQTDIPDSLHNSFLHNPTIVLKISDGELCNCHLSGNIVLYADELRIDSTCRIENLIVCARKVTVGQGSQITAQIFTRDTLLVEAHAKLKYPSGLYTQNYTEISGKAALDGYVIVRDTATHDPLTASCRQARTARTRGLVWIDGIAHIQGIISGHLIVRQAAYFLPHGYYKDMFCDMTLLENPQTIHPLWLCEKTTERKEVVCVD